MKKSLIGTLIALSLVVAGPAAAQDKKEAPTPKNQVLTRAESQPDSLKTEKAPKKKKRRTRVSERSGKESRHFLMPVLELKGF